jgi:II/X family phage/plasmid replication protein
MERWGDAITIQGSPARAMSGRDNTFGSSDVVECARAMARVAELGSGVRFGDHFETWTVSRVDVTESYDLGALSAVRQGLLSLRHAEGGRYQLRTAAESVYWGTRSALRSGKAYAKGPHLRHLANGGKVALTERELALADRLLRLELSLRAQYWRERAEKPWYEHTAEDWSRLHADYFEPLVGTCEITEMDDLRDRLLSVAKTPGLAQAAWRTWALVRSHGAEQAKANMSVATWKRHRALLFKAGLSWADLQAGNVVPLRRKPIFLGQPTRSWEELRQAAGLRTGTE